MEKQVQFFNKKTVFNENLDIPDSPGIYKFYDSQNEILYIGKAKNIKKRVSSYLTVRKGEGKRIKKLKANIKFIETIITNTESDALILEQGLISKIRPPFNVQFRDDKSYPAIHLSTKKDYPAIYISRKKDGDATSFGPYANVGAMRLNVNLIRSIFNLRNCKDINFKNRSRPCIEYQMNRCSAPCVGKISKDDYRKDVKNAIDFLSGDTKKIVKDLNKNMDYYSQKEDYERAIIYRDKIQAIRDTQRKQNVLTGFNELDVIAIKRNKYNSCISVVRIEDGWINNSKNYYPDSSDNFSDSELLSSFIEKYVSENSRRKEINLLLQGEIKNDTLDFVSNLKEPIIKIISPSRKNKNLIDICSSQAEDALSRNNNYLWIANSFESLSAFIKTKNINRIEAFDISHTSGNQVSASCVVVNKEGPIKKDYRLMNLKSETNDDYQALSEAINRRCKNLLSNKKSLPDVILIDGGKGQLNSVLKILNKDLRKKITFFSISKGPNRKEKYDYLHFKNKAYELNKLKDIGKLLQLLRNESHRFALNQHRKRRSKKFFSSNLDNIQGIGPKLKIKLIRYFGGIDKLMEASPEELASLPGIGIVKAREIYNNLNKEI